MILLLEMGRLIGQRRRTEDAAGARTGLGAIDAAVFSLLGLLIAFTFSGAAMRFDARRQLAVQDCNCVGTAWLRLDMLPASAQPEMRELFRRYVDARLGVVNKLPVLNASLAELERSKFIQSEIWNLAVAASRESATPTPTMLVLPALNQMFDMAATRTAAAFLHPPFIIFAMLIVLSLASALLAGHGMAGAKLRSWLHMIGLAATVSAAVFVIIDLEFPRAGLIRLEEVDRLFLELRQSMNIPQ